MWVAVTIICLAVFFFLLLWIPLDMVMNVDLQRKIRLKMRLVWFFGFFSREIGGTREKPKKKIKVTPRRRSLVERTKSIGLLFELLRIKGVLRQVMRLLKDVFKQFKVKDFEASVRVGLDDPADTGLIFALVGSATPFLGPGFSNRIRVQPVFDGSAVFEGYLHGALRLQPIKLALPLARFVFSPAAVRVGKTFVLHRWTTKK